MLKYDLRGLRQHLCGFERQCGYAQRPLGAAIEDPIAGSIALPPTQHTHGVLDTRVSHIRVSSLGRHGPGFTEPVPVAERDKANHSGIRFGNEAMDSWGACPALGSAAGHESDLRMDVGQKRGAA